MVTSSCGRKIHCVGLSKNGKTIGCALWFCDKRPDSGLERNRVALTLNGVQLKNPVYVDMLTGNVHSLPELSTHSSVGEMVARFSELPLWDCPIVLINKDAVRMKE